MSRDENTATEKRDVYATVTAQIITAIENGVGNWRMPWHTSGRHAFSPINVTSHKPYRGINTVCLWAAAGAKGYESGEWGTYKQWQDRGAQVRKGVRSTTVVFWKFANASNESQDGEESVSGSSSRLLFTRGYSVFNAAQVDGYTPKAEPDMPVLERVDQAEAFFRNIGADLRHGGNQAYYSPSDDHIQMPPFQAFEENVGYYSTLAHEHTHWTGQSDRCDRQLGKRFGDYAYGAEELIAELGAAFTCAHLGLSTEPREDHAQYIQSWLRVLKADKRAIFTAASKASTRRISWLSGRSALLRQRVTIKAELTNPPQGKGADVVPSPSPFDQVREFIRASKAESTLRGYRSDWRHFLLWSEARGLSPLPASPETVAVDIAECAGRLKVGSLQRRLNAIAEAHKAVGLESPTSAGMVRNTLKGIKRTIGTTMAQKAPTLTEDVRKMLDAADASLIGLRDRALILLGFAGAFRRSELIGFTLRRSKTDQAAQGRKIGIPYGSNPETCPVRVLRAWMEQARVSTGPVFRSINRHGQVQPGRMAGIAVASIVKKLAERAGLDPARYAGHSLRAGHATAAAIAGASERSIMNQTGHRSVQMVRRYIRDGNLFRENSAGKLGL